MPDALVLGDVSGSFFPCRPCGSALFAGALLPKDTLCSIFSSVVCYSWIESTCAVVKAENLMNFCRHSRKLVVQKANRRLNRVFQIPRSGLKITHQFCFRIFVDSNIEICFSGKLHVANGTHAASRVAKRIMFIACIVREHLKDRIFGAILKNSVLWW